jgi:nucleoid-associated protein YgaU
MTARGNRTRQQVTVSLLEYVADVRVVEDSAANRARFAAAVPKTKQGAAAKRVKAGPARTHQLSTSPPPKSGAELAASNVVTLAATAATIPPVVVGGGDDLLSIAAKELGDANRWVEIAQLNNIRDPRSVVLAQEIRLP